MDFERNSLLASAKNTKVDGVNLTLQIPSTKSQAPNCEPESYYP
jgi:hypothetical protein